VATVRHLIAIAGTEEYVAQLSACLRQLDLFRLSRQLLVLDDLLTSPTLAAAGRRA
jgi:hypothetical protein